MKSNKLKIFLSIVCITVAMPVFAIQTVQIEKNSALTLNDCIKIGLNNSPVVRKYILNLDIAKSSIGVAKSAYFPSLSLGAGYKQGFGERTHNYGSYNYCPRDRYIFFILITKSFKFSCFFSFYIIRYK